MRALHFTNLASMGSCVARDQRWTGRHGVSSSHPASRRLRRKGETELNYMYARLGTEPDDSSDDDFVVDEYDEEEEDKEQLSTDESEEGVILPTGDVLMFCYIVEFIL
ncbi:unnamed protein product [Phytophthora fragariaefolia]|uniref:Unnamed protein product n=1 Tax=Phytophthora fragariaefolia TaxID=1490495 RepID=A0A9W6XQA6_9STRA|nr:unnamed protein product [Phytophthora fragariaefolia]